MLNRNTSQSLFKILCNIGDKALGAPKGTTLSMLLIESLSMGRYLPVRDFERVGATPHVYNEKTETFYRTTMTYIPGLLRWHLSYERIFLRRQMIEVLENIYGRKNRDNVHVLFLGDGIGIDSLMFARLGYRVTYFDLEGYSRSFAKLLFRYFNAQVRIVTNARDIEINGYNCVVNCDVLEHVPDPKALISKIAQYLKPNGLALVTEAFGWLEPYAVSHLLSNVAYVGKLPKLFAECNMYPVQRKSSSRLHVYSKAIGQELKRQRKLLGYSSLSAWHCLLYTSRAHET